MKISEKVKQYSVKHSIFGVEGDLVKNGCFLIPYKNYELFVIASSGDSQWEHVSVSIVKAKRPPNWEEMCFIKDLFFTEDETVVQFHPKKSEYVNNHPFALHLWKRSDSEYELPPSLYLGLKDRGVLSNEQITPDLIGEVIGRIDAEGL